MQILTKELQDRLLANARQQLPLRGAKAELDFLPVVKWSLSLSMPWARGGRNAAV
tara:strand:+ start:218 stop:382 length:165 start_codon:yes stop_codon:yes gene_type:complete